MPSELQHGKWGGQVRQRKAGRGLPAVAVAIAPLGGTVRNVRVSSPSFAAALTNTDAEQGPTRNVVSGLGIKTTSYASWKNSIQSWPQFVQREAYPTGMTMLPIGTSWLVRLLSPLARLKTTYAFQETRGLRRRATACRPDGTALGGASHDWGIALLCHPPPVLIQFANGSFLAGQSTSDDAHARPSLPASCRR